MGCASGPKSHMLDYNHSDVELTCSNNFSVSKSFQPQLTVKLCKLNITLFL